MARPRLRFETVALAILVIYPFVPVIDWVLEALVGESPRIARQLINIYIFAILGLALNVQVGYAGLLQLGIAAFFAIGAFSTGVLTVEKYPFQLGFWGALVGAPLVAGFAGLALGAPTVRLRGDYLAIVTLGFGEVVRVVILNLESITDGPRGLNPVPRPWLPARIAPTPGGGSEDLVMYYVALALLVGLFIIFTRLEKSRMGRALVALREDALAASSIGLDPTRIKLFAFAAGAAVAGLAGALYASTLTTTAEPGTYDFNYSVMVLCCLIIGGLGSLRGVVIGAFVLLGFDNVVSPYLTRLLQRGGDGGSPNVFLTFTNWRWIIFGLALVLVMRFRPEGLWPSRRVREEMHVGPDPGGSGA
ncbi:MAG: branched-chain amino acid ABC transporter permease [Deltaproteobacteria bacterium]|nr:branched-chain amino acid ABC transporter permease [Deltaproteobacteria bacterium]